MAVPNRTVDGRPQRVPHIGWNQLLTPKNGRSWDGTVMAPFAGSGPAFYFVHSFAPDPADPTDRLAERDAVRRVHADVYRRAMALARAPSR